MKFSTQEEYGLRCLLRIARSTSERGMTIPEISEAEGLSQANAAKILRALRLGGFIESVRGQSGGYSLSKPTEEIKVSDVMAQLGGRLFDQSFCLDHAGADAICTHDIDCSIRSLWKILQDTIDGVLDRITLRDLIGSEEEVETFASKLADESTAVFIEQIKGNSIKS